MACHLNSLFLNFSLDIFPLTSTDITLRHASYLFIFVLFFFVAVKAVNSHKIWIRVTCKTRRRANAFVIYCMTLLCFYLYTVFLLSLLNNDSKKCINKTYKCTRTNTLHTYAQTQTQTNIQNVIAVNETRTFFFSM